MRASSGLWSGSPNPVRSEDAFDIISFGCKNLEWYVSIISCEGEVFLFEKKKRGGAFTISNAFTIADQFDWASETCDASF